MEWNADILVALAGVVTSLVFAYVPGISEWFDGLEPKYKPLWNLGVLVAVAIGRLLWVSGFDWPAIQAQLPQVAGAFFAALLANMATFTYVVKQPKKAARLARG